MKKRARERTLGAVGVLLCMLLACPCALALDPNLDISQYAHTAWKIRDGFARGEIHSIAQTPDGYLWLGTDFGLLRFDGVRTVPWQPLAGQPLPSNQIWSLVAPRDGALWIGTSNGLASWKNGKMTQYPELAGKYVFRLLEDREGTVWAGALGFPTGKLCAIQHSNIHCAGEDGTLGRGVLGLYEDSKGNLWVGVIDGVWRWKPGSAKFYPLPRELNGIRALTEDADGSLLIGMHDGIRRLVGEKTELAYPISGNGQLFEPQELLRDSDGGLWITTKRHGLMHLHQGRADVFTQADGLSGTWPSCILEDREGNIWVSTTDGLDRFRGYTVATLTVHQGLSDTVLHSVLADKNGSVWLSTISGLNRWDEGKITAYRSGSGKPDGKLNGENPNSLFQDVQGRVWASTQVAIGYLDKDRFVPVTGTTGGAVLGIAEDSAGSLWIAHQEQGLLHLFHNSIVQQIPAAALGHQDFISALAADRSDGGLWLGFFDGGIAYFAGGSIRAYYSTANGLADGHVNDLRLDQNGILWVATQDGLSRLKDGRIATFSGKNGLPCDGVHWTIEDADDHLWLYMPCGLARIARSELEAAAAAVEKDHNARWKIQFTLLDSFDGVWTRPDPGGYVPRVTKSADGRLWFTTLHGISVFDPRHLLVNKLPPPAQIEQITADHKTHEATPDADGQVRLPPRIRDLQIDYTALSFVAPEKVLFRYKLEGWDRDWQDAGTRRQAFYSNLPPRNYTFRVKACNNSGVWNEAGASLNFSVERAYYQTWWFRSLCVTVFLALLWAVYRWRVQQLRSQEKRLRDVVDTIPAMAFTASSNGFCTFVNKRWTEYTGLSVEQTAGIGWQRAVHAEDLVGYSEKWRLSVASGQLFEDEARFRRASNGEYRWFLVRGVPLRDRHRKVVKWYGTLTEIEDRKRAEEKLRRSEAYLSEAQKLSHMGSFGWDVSSGEIHWSLETFRIFEYDPTTKVTIDLVLQRIHPEDRPAVEQLIERVSREGTEFDFEHRLLMLDGSIKYLRVVGDPSKDHPGSLQFVGAITDITERKQAEESLRRSEDCLHESEQSLRLIVDGIAGLVAIMTAEGEVQFVNNQTLEYFGKTLEELKGWSTGDAVHPDDLPQAGAAWMHSVNTGDAYDVDHRLRRADGAYRWFHSRGLPFRDAEGRIARWYVLLTDIDDRKRADQKFRDLLESAPDAMVVMDRQGQILLVNAQVERLFGYKREELLGQDVVILMPERFRGRHSLRRTEYFAHPRVRSMGQDLELYARRSDGTEFPMEISISPLETEEGTLVSAAVRDITERKYAEQEREKLHQLEADMAHINRVSMLGEMAASLAHEIKQPIAATITSANTCVEWLAQEPPNLDRARAAAARIDKYGNRATEIIDRIRSLYKKSPAQRELVDMNGIIEELFALLKCEADRYSINMRTELCAELPRITADRVQLQQVFMNLMLNAIEAMKESGGELTVRSQREASQLLFSVSDTGVGLPTEKVDQIFSAFFTTKPQGSGMGLAISRSIVESHGGRLWASANNGRGATFHFSLPTEKPERSRQSGDA